jgi:hypothetical protein
MMEIHFANSKFNDRFSREIDYIYSQKTHEQLRSLKSRVIDYFTKMSPLSLTEPRFTTKRPYGLLGHETK